MRYGQKNNYTTSKLEDLKDKIFVVDSVVKQENRRGEWDIYMTEGGSCKIVIYDLGTGFPKI